MRAISGANSTFERSCMKIGKVALGFFLLPSLFFLQNASVCQAYMFPDTPSCHDDVATLMKKPGESPLCTPPIIKPEIAKDFLNKFKVKKIKEKWYLFLSPADFQGGYDAASRWEAISILVSAIESLFQEKAECLIVKIPETAAEKAALLAGTYPKKLVAAIGRHAQKEKEIAEKDWPEYHHHLFYKLTVY